MPKFLLAESYIVLSQFTRLSDGRTDGFIVANTTCRCKSRWNNNNGLVHRSTINRIYATCRR